MSGQCSLCLSCGAPFLPIGEDMVVYDRVGNISVFYFQKLVKNNDVVQKTVVRPNFCAKSDASHILHQAHHKHAVEYTIEKRLRVMERGDQLFPFMRTPGGKNKHPFLAQWAPPTPAQCLDMQALARFIDGLPADGHQAPDYTQTVMCCKDCNMAMTMKFWFQYHLCAGSQVNATCIIPDGVVQVFRANRNGQANSLDTSVHWTAGAPENNYPLPAYQRNHDVLTAMLGYYLALCEPHATPALMTPAKLEHRALYTHMCWVVLEVTCLLCEYWRGSRDAEQRRSGKKRYRCLKTPLGAIELYFSYFCWRILGFRYHQMRGMSFPTWHQIYMWYAGGCEQLFPRKEGEPWNRLIADRIAPDDMYMGSRELVREVGINMTRVLRGKIMKLGAHVCGVAGRVELRPYFLHRQYIQDLRLLMMRRVARAHPCLGLRAFTLATAGAPSRTSTRSPRRSASTP